MMRTILVPLGRGLSSQPALDAALSLAKRLNSHIRTVYVRPDPSVAEQPATSVTDLTDDMGNSFPVSFIAVAVAVGPVGLWVTHQGYPQIHRPSWVGASARRDDR